MKRIDCVNGNYLDGIFIIVVGIDRRIRNVSRSNFSLDIWIFVLVGRFVYKEISGWIEIDSFD